ncbi:hypothetical protein CFAM422_009769 [Trichoderma lentiforme]|uniref:Uncharacterized protein n=1 Tax=Trichoderma lentiforme TaxID=1567552 RepID=A0A9P5C913_9HYPO|nr:hypothetical protein CFAM422_009769 [Trichoderma lentiforme]
MIPGLFLVDVFIDGNGFDHCHRRPVPKLRSVKVPNALGLAFAQWSMCHTTIVDLIDTMQTRSRSLLVSNWLAKPNPEAAVPDGSPGAKVLNPVARHSHNLLASEDGARVKDILWECLGNKAIEHAVKEWEVDIILMPIAFPHRDEDIEDVIDNRHNRVLLFAAASNNASWKRFCSSVWPGSNNLESTTRVQLDRALETTK